MKKNFVSIKDLSKKEIEDVFDHTVQIKVMHASYGYPLKGKSLGLVFQKPSTRTRVSFEVGVYQLGGQAIYMGPDDIKLGEREATKDIARVLSRYLDGIVARTFAHEDVLELAQHSTVPVINGLSDLLHPCQVLADLFTIKEKKGDLSKVKLAYVGDGNNVLHSLLYGCSKVGLELSISTPKGYEPNKGILSEAQELAKASGSKITIFDSPLEAVAGCGIIYTDVWTSMGQEEEHKERLKAFKGFQVNRELVSKAKKDVLVMHCLPAHRGEEVTDEVLDSSQSIVYDQAENRLHVQKAILVRLLG